MVIIEWQLCCDDDIVDWNSNSNVMDNDVCPVSVSPWQPNYLPADLTDVSRYPRAVSADPASASDSGLQSAKSLPSHLGS